MNNEATTIEDQIDNFDPNDPEALAALENQLLSGEEEAVESAELETAEKEGDTKAKENEGKDNEESAEEGESKQDDKAGEAEGEASATQEEESVVLTKSGKHTIPYSVLANERERASKAEAQIREMEQQLEDLKAGKPVDVDAEAITTITDEELAEVEDVSPEIAKVLRQNREQIQLLTKQISDVNQHKEDEEKSRKQEEQDEMNAAISANQHLASWQAAANREDDPDTTMWNRAVQVDAMLRDDPQWQGKDFAERFAKVAEVVGDMYGGAEAPADTSTTEKTEAELKADADAKLKENGGDVPTSLSDIPGGAAPAQSDMETIENTSSVALGQKFLDMSPEAMESYLARFGS